MKAILYISILLLCTSIVFAGIDIALPDTLPVVSINDPDTVPTLGGNNVWTGHNTFNNITYMNTTYINVSILDNVTATDYCFTNGTCLNSTLSELNDSFDNYYDKTTSDDRFVKYNSAVKDLDMNDYDINNIDDMNLTGTFRQGVDGNMFIYDIDDELHHVNVDLSRFDEIRTNTFTTDLTIDTFCNATGSYVNITADDDGKISFVANYLGSA